MRLREAQGHAVGAQGLGAGGQGVREGNRREEASPLGLQRLGDGICRICGAPGLASWGRSWPRALTTNPGPTWLHPLRGTQPGPHPPLLLTLAPGGISLLHLLLLFPQGGKNCQASCLLTPREDGPTHPKAYRTRDPRRPEKAKELTEQNSVPGAPVGRRQTLLRPSGTGPGSRREGSLGPARQSPGGCGASFPSQAQPGGKEHQPDRTETSLGTITGCGGNHPLLLPAPPATHPPRPVRPI